MCIHITSKCNILNQLNTDFTSSFSNYNVFILTQDVNLSQIFLSYCAIETVAELQGLKHK